MLIDSDRYQPHTGSGIKRITLCGLRVYSPLHWNAVCFFNILCTGFIIIINGYWCIDLHGLLLQKENVVIQEICFLRILFSRFTFIAVCCWLNPNWPLWLLTAFLRLFLVLEENCCLGSMYVMIIQVLCGYQPLLLKSWKWYKNLQVCSWSPPATRLL